MTIITHRPGALVGLDGFPGPSERPDSPLSQAL
ncbi:hypothetical protein BRADO4281 [Bradyrhizobium sp. ORS 278]|nr:hypothetical protein BRADO4281 [Bradyrhizobium sp. ORS 278]